MSPTISTSSETPTISPSQTPTTASPSSSPTQLPITTEEPTAVPTQTLLSCVDDTLAFNGKNKRNCEKWVRKKQNKIVKKCKKKTKNDDGTKTKVFDICRETCGKVGFGQCKNEY